MELRSILNNRIMNLSIKTEESYCFLRCESNEYFDLLNSSNYDFCYNSIFNKCGLFQAYSHIKMSSIFKTTYKPTQSYYKVDYNNDDNYPENLLFSEDDLVYVHSKNVSELCLAIGKAMNLKGSELDKLEKAGLYHDLGKNKIPQEIINKPSCLSKEEWKIMKNHPIFSYNMLIQFPEYKKIAIYAKYHHERIYGTCYPEGLKGDEIPLISRIISVVDAYEAMTSDRPYKNAVSKEQAIDELIKHSGTQFDKNIVKVFINNVLNK